MGNYRNLLAYQKAFDLAMEIYVLTKSFPAEEKFSLSSQIRRSSRSVCANIVEACKRKRCKDYYVSKLNDAETENAETQVWLDFAIECKYISKEYYEILTMKNDEAGKLIWYMITYPEKFL